MDKLLDVLEEHGIKPEAIVNCLSVLTYAEPKKMGRKLEILEEFEIPLEDIQTHLSILLLGEEEELRSVLGKLKDHDFTGSAMGKCLAMIGEKDEDLEEQEKIFGVFQDFQLLQATIEKCWMGVRKKAPDEIRDLLAVLVAHKIPEEKYAEYLGDFAQISANEWDSLFKKMEESDLDELDIADCLNSLTIRSIQETKDILRVLVDAEVSPERIVEFLQIAGEKTASEIEANFRVLAEHSIFTSDIEEHMLVLKKGKAERMGESLEILERFGIDTQSVAESLKLLYTKTPDEIEDILLVLTDEGITPKAISNCLTVLMGNTADEIGRAIHIMLNHGIRIGAIQGCLSTLAVVDVEKLDAVLDLLEDQDITPEKLEKALNMLASAKAERMQELIRVLSEHGIGKGASQRSLTIYAKAKPKEVDEILTLFEKNGVSQELKEQMWTVAVADRQNFHDMRRVFDLDYVPKNKEKHARKVRWYLKLKEQNEQFLNKKQVEALCKTHHMTMAEFLKGVVCHPTIADFYPVFLEKLQNGGTIYIGGPKEMTQEQMDNHVDDWMELSRTVALSIAKRAMKGVDVQELTSRAMEIIVTKCGNIVDNLEYNNDLMRGAIFKRAYKTLFYHYDTSENALSLTYVDDKGQTREHDIAVYDSHPSDKTKLRETVNYGQADFDSQETLIMECMISLIESGEADHMNEKVALSLGIDVDAVEMAIQGIRQKMIDGKVVRKSRKGHYVFNHKKDKQKPEQSEEPEL